MATLLDVLKFAIARQATELHHLKTAGVTIETVTKYAWLAPDGKTFRIKQPAPEWKRGKVTIHIRRGFLNPKHPNWAAFQRARKRVSLLYTALHVLKLGQGVIPEPKEIQKALKAGSLSHHIGRTQRVRQVVFKAWKLLRKLGNRLEHTPARFAEVDLWLAGFSPQHSAETTHD
ncbi:MAG: hypothetical protein K1Y36_23410 [Blastocatellia bacterium]|nr:hypothetical protein [Blastocatellia bacterium]